MAWSSALKSSDGSGVSSAWITASTSAPMYMLRVMAMMLPAPASVRDADAERDATTPPGIGASGVSLEQATASARNGSRDQRIQGFMGASGARVVNVNVPPGQSGDSEKNPGGVKRRSSGPVHPPHGAQRVADLADRRARTDRVEDQG